MEKQFDLSSWLINKTAQLLAQMSHHQQIEFDNAKAVEYLKDNGRRRFKEIVAQVRAEQEESKESFIFSSPGWQKRIFETNLTHALLQFAKEILQYSKLDENAIIK